MVGFGWERLEKTLNIYRQKTVNMARFIDDRCPVNNDVFCFDKICMFILPALLFPNVNLFASKYLFNKWLLVSKTEVLFYIYLTIFLLKLLKTKNYINFLLNLSKTFLIFKSQTETRTGWSTFEWKIIFCLKLFLKTFLRTNVTKKMCASLFYFEEMRKVFPLVKTFLLSSNVIFNWHFLSVSSIFKGLLK